MNKIIVFLHVAIISLATISLKAQNYVETTFIKGESKNSKMYHSITADGAWCWFSDPRAVYYEGKHKKTYSSWINSKGDIYIGCYDHTSKKHTSKLLYKELEVDDHDNPAILIDGKGYLLVFFVKHSLKEPIYLTRSKKPESIEEWEDLQKLNINDLETYEGMRDSYTYTNPVRLTEEDNRIYLFWRGMDYKPNYSISDDNGKTWSKGKILILPERKYANRRPYVKISSNNKDKIHIAFTDGHPRMEPTNSIYYMCYKNGAFHKAGGEKIKDISEIPVEPREASVVYDAIETNQKAWIWDVTEDAEGNPVLVYAKFPDDKNHIYCYARWNGKEWKNYDLVNSGPWFPETPEGENEREPNYSGGIILDHENPNVVYLSVKRNGVFEIEKWKTENGGESWEIYPITSGSKKDNVRPFTVKGATDDNPMQVIWMQNEKYIHYTEYQSALKTDLKKVKKNNSYLKSAC